MTVTLEPELENELRQKAAQQGQEADEYVKDLVTSSLHSIQREPEAQTLVPQDSVEWGAQLRSMGRPLGFSLPLEATSRENIYGDDFRCFIPFVPSLTVLTPSDVLSTSDAGLTVNYPPKKEDK